MDYNYAMFVGCISLLLQLCESAVVHELRRPDNVAKIKIVGGSDTVRGDYQWQSLLLIKKKNQAVGTLTLCGGTLIGAKWVLTAAHCVEDYAKMRIYFGVWNVTNRIEVGRVSRTAKRVVRHPCYDGSRESSFTGSNLAMIELTANVFQFQAACLDKGESHDWKQLKGQKSLGGCIATGYGVTDTGNDAEILQKVEFSTVSMQTCNAYGNASQNNGILCASDDKVWGKDTCKGDMGGPLVCPTSRSSCRGYYLAGVTLAGSSTCGQEGKPGIYAAVYPNVRWIKSVMRNMSIAYGKKAYHCTEATIKGSAGSMKPPVLRSSEIKINNAEPKM